MLKQKRASTHRFFSEISRFVSANSITPKIIVYMYVCLYVYMYVYICMHIYVHVCIYGCMYVCVYM